LGVQDDILDFGDVLLVELAHIPPLARWSEHHVVETMLGDEKGRVTVPEPVGLEGGEGPFERKVMEMDYVWVKFRHD